MSRDWNTICRQAHDAQSEGESLTEFAKAKGIHRTTLYIKLGEWKAARGLK